MIQNLDASVMSPSNPPSGDSNSQKRIITPAEWFAERFPLLVSEFGPAVLQIGTKKHGIVAVTEISEDFLAATLGAKGNPEAPTVFVGSENRFWTYSKEQGIFVPQRETSLLTELSALLFECAQATAVRCDNTSLLFKFRSASKLRGILSKARGLLEVPHDYFAVDLQEYVPCANGMLRLADRVLVGFSPAYRRRNKLAVPFDSTAKCPMFLDVLMHPALEGADLDLLQRWAGMALIGENLAQRIMILYGTAGGGKGTFVRVLIGIIGETNIASLRPSLLGERFELSRCLGKTLLYGADVPEDFLDQRGASVLKSLTGYDPITVEFKNSNESPFMVCKYNVLVTCNSRLVVHLEGDADAWRRRLVIIEYRKAKPPNVIADLDKRILAAEASGVLNWMLDGLDKLRADGFQLKPSAEQQERVDNLLLESESVRVFVEKRLVVDSAAKLTVNECYAAYVTFCNERGWRPMGRNKFGGAIDEEVARQLGVATRNDIADEDNFKSQRGWKGIRIRSE